MKDGLKSIAKVASVKQFIVVLQHLANMSLEENFAKYKLMPWAIYSYYIESYSGWSMCSRNWIACCLAVVEEVISHFYCSNWATVMEDLSHVVENINNRVVQFILIKSNIDMVVWLAR